MYDAILIGGGPGGSTAGTLLARAGKRTLVLEKEHFPRFHIGESLLPYNRRIFDELGVMPHLESEGFPRKLGAQFHLSNESKSLKLTFQNGSFTREPAAFQVERSRFDHILLRHAAASGAEVREGWTVTRFENQPDGVLVEASNGAETTKFKARFLLDASGRANLTGNQEGLRIVHPHLKKLAVFGHFDGVLLDEGARCADTVIVRSENQWFWIIPLSDRKVSVGCVIDQQDYASLKLSPAESFQRLWQSTPAMRKRMANAVPLSPIQTTTDFSYYNRRLSGNRLLRVGDAAGFMDPIFSAGVYLAMYSGRLAAQTAVSVLDNPRSESKAMRIYENRVFTALRFYWELVEGFYTRPFMELFLEPRHRLKIPDAIVAILAGELEGGWRIEWRKRLFFLLIRIQRFHALVPRISYARAEESQG